FSPPGVPLGGTKRVKLCLRPPICPHRGGGVGVEAENLATVEVTRIFTPDAVLPVQRVSGPAEGWLQRLYLAVLDDTLRCLGMGGVRGGPRARARSQHEAWAWVLSDADYCFSCTTVCSVLHLNAQAVRHQLRHYLAWREALARPACHASCGNRFRALRR